MGLEKVAAFTEEGPRGLVSACWPVFPGDGDWGRIQPQSSAVPLLKTPASHMERRY